MAKLDHDWIKCYDLVRGENWEPSSHVHVNILFHNGFSGTAEPSGLEVVHKFSDNVWERYKKPITPEWDWEEDYIWGKSVHDKKVYLFEKLASTAYAHYTEHLSDPATISRKCEIKSNFPPTTRPDNFKDYGIDE